MNFGLEYSEDFLVSKFKSSELHVKENIFNDFDKKVIDIVQENWSITKEKHKRKDSL